MRLYYINKNANWYNVLEKVVMIIATGFALGYAININNNALIINYAPLFGLDTIALYMRAYYAYKNKDRDVKIIDQIEYQIEYQIDNPIHTINSDSSFESL